MLIDDVDDLSRFMSELQNESDRGLPLIAAALLDDLLRETLLAFLVERKATEVLFEKAAGPVASFSARIDLCYALALIDEHEHREIHLIRKIRNEFAHAKHGKFFVDPKVSSYCRSLTLAVPVPYPAADLRFRFVAAVISLVMRLYYRPKWVAKERRASKAWVTADSGSWRAVQRELPEQDQAVLTIGTDRSGYPRFQIAKYKGPDADPVMPSPTPNQAG